MRAVAVRRIDSSSFSAYCRNAVAEKLTLMHKKATLQPYRTSAALTATELQPDGQNEELQRRHDDASREEDSDEGGAITFKQAHVFCYV